MINKIKNLFEERILVLDGAMGTMVQSCYLKMILEEIGLMIMIVI